MTARDATLAEILGRYLACLEAAVRARRPSPTRRLAPATLAAYRQIAGNLLRVLGTDAAGYGMPSPIAAFGRRDVERYICDRQTEGASPATIARELVPLRGALRLAKKEGRWRGDVLEVFPTALTPKRRPRAGWLSRRSLDRLLAELPLAYAAIVAFVVATSAGWSAVVYAQRCDILDDGAVVRVRGTRRAARHRLVHMETEDQQRLLRDALDYADGEGGMLFRPWPNARHDLRVACGRAGIRTRSPDHLRRTVGAWMAREGVPAATIARRTGLVGAER